MKTANPFANLGSIEQKLYQDTTPQPQEKEVGIKLVKENRKKSQNAGIPANQKASKPALQNAGNMASQNTGMTANQHAGNTPAQQDGKITVPAHITATEKVTYRFHAEGKYAVEDMKTILARKHGIKASLEEIAEESILLAYEELLENQNASKLANRLARTPENKKSS